jgi:hypothetical protein
MPDISDCFGWGTGFGLPSCGDPAPHSDLTWVDQETSGSSALSEEDCLNLFDWVAYETDATTQPDVPSAATPSPAGPGTNHGDDYPMPDAPSPERQLVWPQVPGPQPPRDTNILLEASPSPLPSTEMHLDGQSHSPLPPSETRKRVVKDLGETNQVREVGSCYRCKMNKIGVGASLSSQFSPRHADRRPPVPFSRGLRSCQKGGCSKSECIRKPLENMVSSTLSEFSR